MDTIELNKILKKQFGNFFIYHPAFLDEFVSLTKESGCNKALVKEFLRKLNMILCLDNIDCGLKWLEHLKKYGNMYSLHLNVKSKNYRLLFSKTPDGKLFLRMFYEKSGKKVTSYSNNIDVAFRRLSEYSTGGFHNDKQ